MGELRGSLYNITTLTDSLGGVRTKYKMEIRLENFPEQTKPKTT